MERFGETILSGGVAAIPFALFRYQAELNLAPEEVWFAAYVLAFKWGEGLPYPSLRKMEKATGVPRRRLHRIKDRLTRKGYLDVINQQREDGGQERNLYDFSGLFDALKWHIEKAENPENPIAEDETPGVKIAPPPVSKRHRPGVRIDTPPGVRIDTPIKKELVTQEESAELRTTPDSMEAEFLSILQTVKGYPFDSEVDLAFYRKLQELFPDIDIIAEARKWAVYKLDRPLKKNSNPRSQFRNWLEIATRKIHNGATDEGNKAKAVGEASEDTKYRIPEDLYWSPEEELGIEPKKSQTPPPRTKSEAGPGAHKRPECWQDIPQEERESIREKNIVILSELRKHLQAVKTNG